MDRWRTIVALAAGHRKAAAATPGIDPGDAPSIVFAALSAENILVIPFGRGEIFGPGVVGCMYRKPKTFFVADWLPLDERAAVLAHELGHFHLHRHELLETVVSGAHEGAHEPEHQGYSPHELKEQQADLYAQELLCPAETLRKAFIAGRRPSELAAAHRIPQHVILAQAKRALLLAPDLTGIPDSEPKVVAMTAVQRQAIEWDGGAVVVQGGPGTGKTTALVARLRHLRACGVPAASILVATPSERAAEAIRSTLPLDVVTQAWIGTLRSFALDIVGKWPRSAHRSQDLKVVDRVEALALVRQHAEADGPTSASKLLKAIWLCKANLVGCDDLVRQADHAIEDPATCDHDRAWQAVATARAYARYEVSLREANAIDAADLVPAAVRIFDGDDAARADCARRFRHVLVDDFEDTNHAERVLIGRLGDMGAKVWVTGSDRTTTRRFEGASGSAIADFRGSRLILSEQVRSRGAPLAAIERLMDTLPHARNEPLYAGPRVSIVTAPNCRQEAVAIAARIRILHSEGVPYREQAVIARAHLTLNRLTETLRDQGIPVAHFGDLRERPEVEDLLAVLRLDERDLGRIARLPNYAIGREDVAAFAASASRNGTDLRTAISQGGDREGISPAGRLAFARMRSDLLGMSLMTPPAIVLGTWLLERSAYLAHVLARVDGAEARMSLLVIHHLLNLCAEHQAMGGGGHEKLRERIGAAASLGQETGYRHVFPETSDLDAVRILTVHASKGLTFEAVHWAGLSDAYQPARYRENLAPLPHGLPFLPSPVEHAADEESLGIIAASRARRHLYLSRAETYASRMVRESPIVRRLAGVLQRVPRPETATGPAHRPSQHPERHGRTLL